MKSRSSIAIVMTAMVGATAFLAVNALAQQSAAPPRPGAAATQRPAFSAEDRGAFFDARIAAVKAGLRLTPDQEKLWPPVESAVREGFAKRAEMMAKMQTQGRPADPVEGMRRMADAASTRGEMMKKIVDAAQPLYASLGDDQKRRLTMLMHRPGGGRMAQMRERMRGMMMDQRGERGMMGRRGGEDERPRNQDR